MRVLLAYLDEFGHIGPYVSATDQRFNAHPVYGYAGFVIPAEHVREFGAYFEHTKQGLLAFEIARDGAHPRRWEKKGAALLTSRNLETYGHEIRPAFRRLARRLARLDGRLIFAGEIKPCGSERATGESAALRDTRALQRVILQLSCFAEREDQPILIFLDAVDQQRRLHAVMAAASFMFKAHVPELRRVAEIPMQLESHFYSTTQYADWLCALVSRASHLHLVNGSSFGWAPRLLAQCFGAEARHVPESGIVHSVGGVQLRMDDLGRPRHESAHDEAAART